MPYSKNVAIAGLGAIGSRVATALLDNAIDGLSLSAVGARDSKKAHRALGTSGNAVPVVPVGTLPDHADIVVECLPPAHFDEVALPTVERGRTLVVLSSGALLSRPQLINQAKETGARIIVPSGAILALDAVRAASGGSIERVMIVTRKPPKSLVGAPLVERMGIELGDLVEPLLIFEGSVSDAIEQFPANVNVAASVSLAGIGPDKTRIEVWADPRVSRNTQTVTLVADSTSFTATIESEPSPDNPRTGMMTPLSVIAALKRISSPLVIGS